VYIYIFKNPLYPSESRKVVTSFPIKDRRALQDMVNGGPEWRQSDEVRKNFWTLIDIHT